MPVVGVVPHRSVIAVFIEIQAVAARVAEDSVQYYPDAALSCSLCKILEILIRSERRLYVHIITRVVTVVRCRLEHRIQVDACDSERLYVIQSLFYALEASAVHRPSADPAASVTFIERGLRPVLLHKAPGIAASSVDFFAGGFGPFAPVIIARKAVRKYLVYYTFSEPTGYFRRLIHRYLIAGRVIIENAPLAAESFIIVPVIYDLPSGIFLTVSFAFALYLKSVPQKAALIRGLD